MFCCGASQNPNKGEDRSLVSGSMGKGAMLTSKAGQKVGFFSYHGWEKQGWAKTVKPKINQDRIFITPKLCDSGTSWLFCVYDGNGPKGEKVAQEAGAEIVAAVEGSAAKVTDSSTDVPKVLKDAFVESNKKVCKLSSAEKSGCTATVILVQDLTTLFVANVGDSKAILGKAEGSTWKAKVLTEEHKPNAAAEKARIEAAGGFVLEDEEYGAARVFDTPDPVGQMVAMASAGMSGGMGGGGMVSSMEPWPGLAMSRCLGHTGVDKIGITAEPTVSTHKIFNDDQVLLVASDGGKPPATHQRRSNPEQPTIEPQTSRVQDSARARRGAGGGGRGACRETARGSISRPCSLGLRRSRRGVRLRQAVRARRACGVQGDRRDCLAALDRG